MIKDLHKECVCASCEYFCRTYLLSEAHCVKHRQKVKDWNLCPDYEESSYFKADPSPRSGPWVVSGT